MYLYGISADSWSTGWGDSLKRVSVLTIAHFSSFFSYLPWIRTRLPGITARVI